MSQDSPFWMRLVALTSDHPVKMTLAVIAWSWFGKFLYWFAFQ